MVLNRQGWGLWNTEAISNLRTVFMKAIGWKVQTSGKEEVWLSFWMEAYLKDGTKMESRMVKEDLYLEQAAGLGIIIKEIMLMVIGMDMENIIQKKFLDRFSSITKGSIRRDLDME